MEGVLLDISRGSIHDGPGIRTTVFLKGCPLKCQWCHNPESQSIRQQLSFNPSRCVGCGACEAVCSRQVHKISSAGHQVDFKKCMTCGACVEVCSYKALSIYGRTVSTEEVLKVVRRDKDFYDTLGGGVTISGGEPSMQPLFCGELLQLCREEGVHTAVETCGFCAESTLCGLMPYTDLFLFDWKIHEEESARIYIGQSNQRIVENLHMLLKEGAKVILRCPIIPGVNDTEDHFASIKELLEQYPDLYAELMPYHNFGVNKATHIDMEQKEFPIPSDEMINGWLAYFADYGVRVKRG